MTLLSNWKFFALLSAIFASLTAIFGKVGVSHLDSNLATWFRTVVIVCFLGAFLIFKKIPISQVFSDQRSFWFLILSALCTGASWMAYYRALQLGPVSRVAPVDKLSVVLTVLMSVLFLGEALTLKTIVGTILILAGSLVMLL